ncbi:MAG: site-2 protease family protein, partial [Candidatus Omnitrophica bacterium]|nr:site-2 protease family protein [Candidatus Omnitrophota bacterium]
MAWLASCVVLGTLVVVHEFGHLLVAKWCGVRVLRFSIGFGPRLANRRVGDTEYAVSLLPLGGYVKLAGEQPQERANAP